MGKISKFKFIFRSILLCIFILIFLRDESLIIEVLDTNIFNSIKLYHIIWLYLFLETLLLAIPYTNNHTYNGKLFSKHYLPVENFSEIKLKKYMKFNNLNALSAVISWVVLNFILAIIYYKYKLNISYIYLIFLIYYWCDMFCVNVWCPFNRLFFKNKCCNECRIYNWDHVMFFTPFLLIKNFWTYSLILLSLFLFIQWEYMIIKYPERFSPISNKKLQCNYCKNDCRFKKKKKAKIQINKDLISKTKEEVKHE